MSRRSEDRKKRRRTSSYPENEDKEYDENEWVDPVEKFKQDVIKNEEYLGSFNGKIVNLENQTGLEDSEPTSKEESPIEEIPSIEEVEEQKEKDKEEDDEDEIFNTEFDDEQLAALDLNLNEIPDRSTDDGPDAFDTKFATASEEHSEEKDNDSLGDSKHWDSGVGSSSEWTLTFSLSEGIQRRELTSRIPSDQDH